MIRSEMAYTLREAARATGLSKATIHRAVKSGRISAQRLEDGSFRLDPAELHRVFPPVSAGEAARDEPQDGTVRRSETPSETAAKLVQLETENAGLREMIAA